MYFSRVIFSDVDGYGAPIGRKPAPDKEITTLSDYRIRIGQYRTDLDLVASHQYFAWIPTWDDVYGLRNVNLMEARNSR
jgi:phosphodiesterase/alkaline phosphatase D-like protein